MYYSLLECIDGIWFIAFGDFDLDCIKEEKYDSYYGVKTCIIKTSAKQTAIDLAVARLNEV